MSQIEHLATLQNPNGGLSESKACIISWNSEIYICNCTRFVYIFSLEKKQIKAVYLFPSNVWHIELSTGPHQLYVLCAQKGLYLLEWDEDGRLLKEPSSVSSNGDMTIYHIGCNFALLLEPSLCSFTVANEFLVVVSAQQEKWKIAVIPRENINHDDPFTALSREVKFSHRYERNSSDLQPVLCCVFLWKEKAIRPDVPCSLALTAVLFTRLFGVDVAMLESPMILCGFPDGQVFSFPLKSAALPQSTYQNPTQGSLKLLYHLEQPVVSIGTIRIGQCDPNTKHPPEGHRACDCLLVVGQKGLMVSVTGDDNPDAVSCTYTDYRLPAPVCGTSYSTSGVFCCTSSDIIYVTISPLEKETATNTASSTLSSIRHSISMIVAVSQVSSPDDSRLVSLSKRGRLMLCNLNRKGTEDHGQRIKELLSGIGSVSERFSALKTVTYEKSKSLARLNQVMSLSRELLSGQWETCPVRCAVRVSWAQMLQKAYITAYCSLENKSDFIFEHNWTLCLLISTDPITSYSFPVLLLKPGETKEFAFPLYGQGSNRVDFPITVSCSLFYSLKEFAADCGNSSEMFMSAPHKHGVCVPLQENVVDILQCLRLSPMVAYCSGSSCIFQEDAVQTICKSSSGDDQQGTSPVISNQGVNSTMPFKASVRLSAALLARALRNGESRRSICSVVLHWLLSEVLAKDQDVQEVQGLTPDGKEFCIRVQEVSVSDLSTEESIQVVEVQILSSHLHVVASLHLAVIGRFKILLQQDNPNNEAHSPDLNLGKIQQLFSAHELLLKEVKNLRERLGVDEDIISSAAAQRLLRIYTDLRDPGLVFI
ncbi:Fanconi anemia core complex-associated protein 100 [Hyla sarda]|uniref:Fanconi anemia core complex-associated protein 100 n=1 Tax=Hyla sarda TaxID=327740 RepID=UPI0024C364C6|nr:Fanconi anemia core complex-associated protein 100 [Hyla sarda]